MIVKTYGRGQVEWAVWRSFTRTLYSNTPIPQVFRTRIKRLLEIDRDLDMGRAKGTPRAAYAFAPPPSAESGEAPYSAVDAFCLAIALDLLDAGFKQAEIVFLMRYLRADLEKRFLKLLTPPSLIDRQRHRAKTYPDQPFYKDNGHKWVDGRVFVIVHKVELTEISPKLSRRRKAAPVFLEPVFCAGITALGEALHALIPDHRRTGTVLEIAATAQAVQAFLDEAPVIRRGRPKTP